MTEENLISIKVSNPQAVLDFDRTMAFLPKEATVPKRGDTISLIDMEGTVFATASVSNMVPMELGATSMKAHGRQIYAGTSPEKIQDRDYDRTYADAAGFGEYMDMAEGAAREIGYSPWETTSVIAIEWDADSLEPTADPVYAGI